MAQPVRIEPDLQFVQELQSVGGDALKKCYQCATCSVVCPISPDSNPFPRKEMIWAGWGLQDKLTNNIDIWLCHNCGTCSDMCPRGAKPADLIAALRNMAYQKANPLNFIGKWLSSVKFLPLLIGIPALIFFIIWIIRAGQLGTWFPTNEEGEIIYGLLYPGDYTIDPLFILVTIFVVWAFFQGSKRLINSFKPQGSIMPLGQKRPNVLKALIDVIFLDILPHKKFTECGAEKADRKFGHMSLLFGFIALAVVTGTVALGHWGGSYLGHLFAGHDPSHAGPFVKLLLALGGVTHTPLPQTNAIKLLANLGAVLLVVGLILLTRKRMKLDKEKFTSCFYDWYLLVVIWVVGLTGIFCELFRLAGFKYLAYPTYFVHLTAVFMLIAYLPWSKLGHLVYRTVALTYARYTGRKQL